MRVTAPIVGMPAAPIRYRMMIVILSVMSDVDKVVFEGNV